VLKLLFWFVRNTVATGNTSYRRIQIGLEITWVERPNSTVYSGQRFSIRYKLAITPGTTTSLFYDQLLQSPHFDQFK